VKSTKFNGMLGLHGIYAVDQLLYFRLQTTNGVRLLFQLSTQRSVDIFQPARTLRK